MERGNPCIWLQTRFDCNRHGIVMLPIMGHVQSGRVGGVSLFYCENAILAIHWLTWWLGNSRQSE